MKRQLYGGRVTRCSWESEDIVYLREHYPHDSLSDIADYFGVSATSVRLKVQSLGLKKAKDYSVRRYANRYVGSYKDERYKGYKQCV